MSYLSDPRINSLERSLTIFLGYCDVFSKCRSVDADGPLARLKKALFNPVLYSSIREWIIEYWNGFIFRQSDSNDFEISKTSFVAIHIAENKE